MEVCSLPVRRVYEPDVLVCGLGPAGLAAATAAARTGASTLGFDKCAFAGGNITNAKVVGICGAVDNFTGALIVGGLALELMKRAAYFRRDDFSRKPIGEMLAENPDAVRHMYSPNDPKKHVQKVNSVRLFFDPEILKQQADEVLSGSGARVLYSTMLADVVVDGGRIREVYIANKDGLSVVRPCIVIDCTGDADVAARAGAPFEIADPVQPGTLMFNVGGLAFDDFQTFYNQCRKAMAKAAAAGEIGHYTGPSVGWMRPGILNFNNTRLIYDATDAESVTGAEICARADVFRFFEIYQKYVGKPFENAYVLDSGPCLGARESRRILGEYVLTLEDIVESREFEDAIGLGGGIVDFHNVSEKGHSSLRFVKPHGIPYRTLLPQNVENLLVAGRCHSVTQMGAAVTRMAITAMLMGEAAGWGAALALKEGCAPRDVDVGTLRGALHKNNGILSVEH